MSDSERREHPGKDEVSAAACAEAAAWIARLHSPDRNEAVDEGLRQWLAAGAEHQAAFELATDLWNETERWPKATTSAYVPRSGLRPQRAALLAAAAAAGIAIIGSIFYLQRAAVGTEVGEQRTITLEDGTRVALNTATRIKVDFDDSARRVELEHGEALFEVAKNANRPFIVTAGDKRITALGTAFVVKFIPVEPGTQNLAVTLVEGTVTVTPTRVPDTVVTSSPALSTQHSALVMNPGERITFTDGAAPRFDRPAFNTITAWQRGQVILDHTPLSDAIQEMNRYSAVQLHIDPAPIGDLEVTGVFRSGDSVSFAEAVAETYDLQIKQEPSRILLVPR